MGAQANEITLEELAGDPHALLAQLREREPVAWIPALEGWLVTRHDLAVAVMLDDRTFTVDDARFSTAQIVGASMLSLDGERHAAHRAPFAAPLRPTAVRERMEAMVTTAAQRLLDRLSTSAAEAGSNSAELRRTLAGPLAAGVVAALLGLEESEVAELLAWYDAIVAGVTGITAGRGIATDAQRAFAALSERLRAVIDSGDVSTLLASAAAAGEELTTSEVISNAAILLFGGIETTEGMIANAILALLEHPDALAAVGAEPGLVDAAVEESLRLEPAAAVIDRYATADVELAGAQIRAGELVRISITAANRDPAVFADPGRYDLTRTNVRRHLAFAQGPHVCLGVHLARLEARIALARLLACFPRLALDPDRPATIEGLVFRKPRTLHVVWG